jgi:hypothetical protein
VVRGRRHILLRTQALCASATRAISLALPAKLQADLARSLAEAHQRGVSLNISDPASATTIELLVDQREALLGTLAPEESCQAVLSSNPALIAALTASFAPAQPASVDHLSSTNSTQPDWLEWENRKQQRLRKNHADQRSA